MQEVYDKLVQLLKSNSMLPEKLLPYDPLSCDPLIEKKIKLERIIHSCETGLAKSKFDHESAYFNLVTGITKILKTRTADDTHLIKQFNDKLFNIVFDNVIEYCEFVDTCYLTSKQLPNDRLLDLVKDFL